MKKYQDSFIFILTIFTIAVSVGSFLIFQIKKTKAEIEWLSPAQILESSHIEVKTRPITLMFVGDIMLDRGVEYMVKKHGKEDYRFPFLKIAEDLKKADILFGNLESVISDKGRKVGSIYSFRADPEAINGLRYAGFDVVSVANNHILDYSRTAMEDSFKRLKEASIDFVGGGFLEEEARSGVIKEVRDPSASSGKAKIAFLAFTNLGSKNFQADKDRSGIAWLDERIGNDIKIAKEKSDLLVVSMHFGNEYQLQPDSNQEYWAHLAIDSGADLVVGHHPHVVQPIKQYKDGWVAYSLGNFIFDQGFSKETTRGLLLEVIIRDAKIERVNSVEIKMNEFFQPEIVKD